VKIFITILLICAPVVSYGNCILTVRVAEFRPQYYQDAGGHWQGIAVELVQALFKEADCRIKFITTPWKRALYLLEHGGLDVLLNMSWTEERALYTHYIGPMLGENQVLIVSQNTEYKIDSLEDVKKLPKRIGIERGVFYGSALMHKLQTDQQFFNQFEYGSSESNTDKLIRGRILGMINNQYTAAYKIKHVFSKDAFKQHPFMFHQNAVYFGFSKKVVNVALRKRFEQAFSRLLARGVLETIASKYR